MKIGLAIVASTSKYYTAASPLLLALSASGAVPPQVASESRDAATAYILTQNFIVGRTARDCFTLLGRPDAPKDFVGAWQKRNAKYYAAALGYIDRRLAEAAALGGAAGRNTVVSALSAAIDQDGSGAVADFFKKGERRDVCVRVIGLMEKGVFDIDARSPMYSELQALIAYTEGQ